METSNRSPAGIFYRTWAGKEVKCFVMLVHGAGVHGGLYAPLAERLVEVGAGVIAVDLKGHGRSTGTRGHISRFEEYARDLVPVAEYIQGQGKPWYLYGESLGGLVVVELLTSHPTVKPEGLILTAPAFKLLKPVPRFLYWGGRGIGLIAPNVRFPIGMAVGKAMDFEACPEFFDPEDPLLLKEFTLGWGLEFLRAQKRLQGKVGELRVRTLWLIPGSDQLVDSGFTKDLARKLPPDRNLLRWYPDAGHVIYCGPKRNEAFEDIAAFMGIG